jgi:hypothetical protein
MSVGDRDTTARDGVTATTGAGRAEVQQNATFGTTISKVLISEKR